MLQKIKYNLDIALEAIRQNTMRSFLTSLGIIFGVASVISMLAIGRGAQKKVLQQLQLLGANNIIIEPAVPQGVKSIKGNSKSENSNAGTYALGLTMADMHSIKKTVPEVTNVSPVIIYQTTLVRNGRMGPGRLVGVNREYFNLNNFEVAKGHLFSEFQMKHAKPVAVIGAGIKARFFPRSNPIGKWIKAKNVWLKVIGVLQKRNISSKNIKKLNLRNYNMDVYSPARTVLMRYNNRVIVTQTDIKNAATTRRIKQAIKTFNSQGGGANITFKSNNDLRSHNQLNKLIVQVSDNKYSPAVAGIIRNELKQRHNGVADFKVIVPQQLLKQEQQTQQIFSLVLSAIASISLLVGGIGIMNIMLASIVERYREIGVRRAVGALKSDINLQFLTEALVISVSGGIIGIIIGIVLSYIIKISAGIPTVVTVGSVLLSFFVAVAVGIVFGFFPAKKAAEQDPVNALRHE